MPPEESPTSTVGLSVWLVKVLLPQMSSQHQPQVSRVAGAGASAKVSAKPP